MTAILAPAASRPVDLAHTPASVLRAVVRGARPLLPFVLILVAWWTAKIALNLSDRVLASPVQVATTFLTLCSRGVLADYAAASLNTIGIAVLVSGAIGIPLGFAIGANRYMARSFGTFLRFFQGVSGISWLPLAIIWLGFTNMTTLSVVVYTLVVPIVFNTMLGVRALPANYALAMRSLGASRLRIVRDVYLPGALPSIIVGLRLGIGYGWRALIAAEMLIRQGGLGDLVFGARTFGQIDRIVCGMIVIGLLYVAVDRLIIQTIENLTLARWGVLRR